MGVLNDPIIIIIVVVIGASLSEPHINGTAMRAIYGICIYVYMYICIYVYMYICIYGTSVTRAPLHRHGHKCPVMER